MYRILEEALYKCLQRMNEYLGIKFLIGFKHLQFDIKPKSNQIWGR